MLVDVDLITADEGEQVVIEWSDGLSICREVDWFEELWLSVVIRLLATTYYPPEVSTHWKGAPVHNGG